MSLVQRIRVGVIGTGFGARVHAPWLSAHPGYDMRCIASVHRSDPDRIRSDSGVDHVYQDWREMLDKEQLDLLVVASAPALHREMTLEGLSRGLHVLCEKPMAQSVEEAAQMCDARESAGREGFINFEFRFRPARLAVREIVKRGEIGDILHVQYRRTMGGLVGRSLRRLGWLGDSALGGGSLGALGSHMFDALHFLTGLEAAEVSGQLETLVPEANPDGSGVEIRTADDTFTTFGKLANGAGFSVGLVLGGAGMEGTLLDIQGTRGQVRMVDDARVFLSQGDESLAEVDLQPLSPDLPELSGAAARYPFLYPCLDRIHQMIAGGAPDPLLPTFADGLRVQRVLDGVRASSSDGRRVQLHS